MLCGVLTDGRLRAIARRNGGGDRQIPPRAARVGGGEDGAVHVGSGVAVAEEPCNGILGVVGDVAGLQVVL